MNGVKQGVSERRLPAGESMIRRVDGVEATDRRFRSEKFVSPRRGKIIVAAGLNDRAWKLTQAGNPGVRLKWPRPMRR